MAVNRYDQRKNYEEAEANAIGTEYVRPDLLPTAAAARVRSLLIFQMAEVMVPRNLFQQILTAIAALRPLPPVRC
jgi:hypothetical protein